MFAQQKMSGRLLKLGHTPALEILNIFLVRPNKKRIQGCRLP